MWRVRPGPVLLFECGLAPKSGAQREGITLGSSLNRWLVSAGWLAMVLALVAAATVASIGVAALWSIPAALMATVVVMGWPDKPMTRIIGVIGLVWQLALIGAYWPFATSTNPGSLAGLISWPLHSVVILGVLAVLTLAFLALFVGPGLRLRNRLGRAARIADARPDDVLQQLGQQFHSDPALLRHWQEYLNQVRPSPDATGRVREFAHASARAVFDAVALTHSRLRLEFFRNLPGMLTGIGIIGTFSGLIMGLRQFRISEDPRVVQKSLEALLGGVWEAFVVSAMAITLAIAVTLIEKLVLSAISRQFDHLSLALDGLYPPRPQPESESWAPKLIEVLQAMGQRNAAVLAAPAHAAAAAPMVPRPMMPMPMEAGGSTSASLAQQSLEATQLAGLGEILGTLQELTRHSLQATTAMSDLARGLPELMAQHLTGGVQAQVQSAQVMKTLSAKLEGVASGIELSGRKTLETVAARLMQSEMNMVSRHHAVAEHLGELVQRIEALCGLLQQDRADFMQGAAASQNLRLGGLNGHEPANPPQRWGNPGGRDEGYRTGQQAAHPGPGRSGYAPQEHYPQHDPYTAPEPAYGGAGDGWGDPTPQDGGGRFGS